MLSSPDVQVWEPLELTAVTLLPVSAPAPAPFVADAAPATARRAPLFEIATDVGIPSALLDPARRAAASEGYAAGWAEGMRAARDATEAELAAARRDVEAETAAFRARVEQALSGVLAAAADLRVRSAPALEDVERIIVSAAFEIAESVVGASLRDDDRRGAAAVARALALVPDDDRVVVALHPADHATLVAAGVRYGPCVELVADPTLSPGDATARSGATTVDARIAAGLARVWEALAP